MAEKISVQGNEISIISRQQEDYISLTDIAKYRNKQEPFAIINNWMRNRSTIEFLGLWEKLSNPDFKPLEFERFKSEAGSNYFVLLTKINYRIHTEAISENLGPAELSKQQMKLLTDDRGIKKLKYKGTANGRKYGKLVSVYSLAFAVNKRGK